MKNLLLALGLLIATVVGAHAQGVRTATCGGVQVPAWVTENRPSSPNDGTVGFNRSAGYCEQYSAAQDLWSPQVALFPRVMRSGISPSLHLVKFLASSTPTVCFVGDSTMAQQPSNTGPNTGWPGITPIDYLPHMLAQRILEDNPSKAVTFDNFAVAGQTWSTFDNAALANWGPWYFNHSLPWLPYIQAANCTSLYINFGVNDADRLSGIYLQAVFQKIAAWSTPPAAWASGAVALDTVITDSNGKLEIASVAGTTGASHPTWATTVGASTTDGTVTWQLLSAVAYVPGVPDIILITNKNVNPNAGGAWSTQLEQWGTLNAAAYQRNAALSNIPGFGITGLPPLGLIDIGRYFTEAFNGFDPAEQYMTLIPSAVGPISAFPYSLPATAGDFDLVLTVADGSDFSAGSQIQVLTGNPGTASASFVQIKPTGTTFSVKTFDGSLSSLAYNATGIWNAGSNTVEITARGDHLYITCNNVVVVDTLYTRFSGPFTPTVSLITPPANPNISVATYSSGTNRPYAPTLNAAAAFGSQGGPQGGNGINHDGSQGENAIDWAVLEATRFGP